MAQGYQNLMELYNDTKSEIGKDAIVSYLKAIHEQHKEDILHPLYGISHWWHY